MSITTDTAAAAEAIVAPLEPESLTAAKRNEIRQRERVKIEALPIPRPTQYSMFHTPAGYAPRARSEFLSADDVPPKVPSHFVHRHLQPSMTPRASTAKGT